MSGNLKLRFHVKQSRQDGKVGMWCLICCCCDCCACNLHVDRPHGPPTLFPISADCLQINFVNVQEGRLITRLLAEFDIKPIAGELCMKATLILFGVACLHLALPIRFSLPALSAACRVAYAPAPRKACTCIYGGSQNSLCAGIDGGAESTDVLLDAQIKAKQLPPPPFKNMVKGTKLAEMFLPSAKWADRLAHCTWCIART